jgi:hypothetical protein
VSTTPTVSLSLFYAIKKEVVLLGSLTQLEEMCDKKLAFIKEAEVGNLNDGSAG